MADIKHLVLPHSFNHGKAYLLRHLSYVSYLVLFLLLVVSGFVTRSHQQQVLGFATNINVADVVKYTNDERLSHGDALVRFDEKLSQAAQEKAKDMFAKNYWAHYGPNGEKPWDFITKSGYTYVAAGENLARDYNDSKAVVDAWMNSPSHRENLLNNNYQDMGIAVVDGTLLGHETTLVVQIFGKPYNAVAQLPREEKANVSSVPLAESAKPTAVAVLPTLPPFEAIAASPADQIHMSTFPNSTAHVYGSSQELAAKAAPSSLGSLFAGSVYFMVAKSVALIMLFVIMVLLVVDTLIIKRRGVVRIATHSMAHVAMITIMILTIFTLTTGKVL